MFDITTGIGGNPAYRRRWRETKTGGEFLVAAGVVFVGDQDQFRRGRGRVVGEGVQQGQESGVGEADTQGKRSGDGEGDYECYQQASQVRPTFPSVACCRFCSHL